MNCILLAKGEKSLRLGKIKPFIIFQGKPLIEIMLEKTTGLFGKTYIVTTKKEKFKIYEDKKTFIIEDKIKCGPAGGILLGLKESDSFYNFVLSVDLIFIDKNLLKYMSEKEKKYDILLAKTENFSQPLCGIYSKKCIEGIEENIKKKNYKVRDIQKLHNLKIEYIEKKDMEKFGNPDIILFNLNTKDDLKVIREENGISSGST